MRQSIRLTIVSLFLLTIISAEGRSEDWPMWRHDAGRSAASSEQLSSSLSLRWTRQLVAPQMAWPEDPRIHFDAVAEPISAGGLVFLASSTTDSVTAIDAAPRIENSIDILSPSTNMMTKGAPADQSGF